jgi:CheY-like chemotaxis protein/HPt (histidine-containing phosphotransfer) domain-containing protein
VEVPLQGHILLAEDNETNQRLLSLYLRKMGLDVTLVDNGALSMQYAVAHDYDLILMDMQMPVMSGVDAVMQLRQQGYDKPIIALTANATKEDRRQCMEAGCEDFVTKPITRSRLYQAVAPYLTAAAVESSDTALTSLLLAEEPELTDIVIQFVTRLPQLTTSISAAFQQNDWHEFKSEVHKLKGMGSGFGYPQLTELAARLERLFANNNHAAIEANLVELRSLTTRIQAGMPTLPVV